jgi:hypothetical protein
VCKGVLTVQLFQSQLLSLTNEAEDHEPGYQVQSSVESDYNVCQRGASLDEEFVLTSSGRCHGLSHRGEGKTEDTGESVVY